MKTVYTILLLLCVCIGATAQELHETLSEIIVTGVTGSTSLTESAMPMDVLSASELSQGAYTNIIDAVATQPGVSQITTGSGISKPIIRGLGYNRIVVINDGVRQEGQQWGDEHGIEIDGSGVYSIEILKGPASLMYGSDAMAGVLIFHDSPRLSDGTMRLNAAAQYQTNSGLMDYSLDFEGHRGHWIWDARYSEKYSHDYRNAADGFVENSRFRERSASALAGYSFAKGYSHLKLGYYNITLGMVEAEEEELSETDSEDVYDNSYRILAPFQQVYHYKAVWDNALTLSGHTVKAIVGYQQNRRQEFETADECELDMQLHTINYDLHYLSASLNGWKASAGVNGMWQRSLNLGEEMLIPNYSLFDAGFFLTGSKSVGKFNFSGGVRYDIRAMSAEEAFEEDGEALFEAFSRQFGGFSASLGATFNPSDKLTLRLNIARGFRTPNISELASNGVHEGTYRYEIGSNELKS